MKCSICHYVSPPDGPAHNARTCPLKQTQRRRSLREDHPFFEAGQCVSAACVHKQKCNTCGVRGHLYGTQALTVERWKFNNKGRLVRKQTTRPLCKDDFVCALMTELSIRSMVDNSLSVSTAAANDAHQRRVTTSRLHANTNAERLDIDETVRVMERLGSDAAVLQKENKVGFKTLCKNAHLGAVAAGHLAASAAESSMDDSTPPSSDAHVEEDNVTTSSDEGEMGRSLRGKAKRRAGGRVMTSSPKVVGALHTHHARKQSRTDRYASAVAKGQRRSKGGAAAKKNRSKGQARKVVPVAIVDVDEDVTNNSVEASARGWPLATRHRFERNLPTFFSPRFGGTPPVQIAHAAAVELFQCSIDEVDADMASLIVRGATDKHLRGYMLTSGTICAAQVAELLCSAMPDAVQSATLPSMAYAVEQMVAKQAATAAAADGVRGTAPAVSLTYGASATAVAPPGAAFGEGCPSTATLATPAATAKASVVSPSAARDEAARDAPPPSEIPAVAASASPAVREPEAGVADTEALPRGSL